MIGADIEINIKEEFSEHSEILEPQNLRQIYKGTVNNNTESLVYGKLSDNKFDGYFMINAKYYYIEPVTNLEPESKSQLCIIYITGGRNSLCLCIFDVGSVVLIFRCVLRTPLLCLFQYLPQSYQNNVLNIL
jgi:hypothetical protein